jgi:DNA-3-methyladenine glycosylase
VLSESFYQRQKVVTIARDLLGKVLVTRIQGQITAGLIVETEAYSWRERGCHAYNQKRTARNEVMFGPGGRAYVYLCYGIHHLFNVVTNEAERAEAVLVRAIEPADGIDIMLRRTDSERLNRLTSGPGKLTRALGISRQHNGYSLLGDNIWLEDGVVLKPRMIDASPRIGIGYAGEDARLPWRFTVRGNSWVSVPPGH